ncbi:polyprotein [Frankliniella fusca]|uniref:Polyprotein n=1 Tax=Frankliniella fusca TaxID=407009 RepID=A0AAE1GUM5_9NEOP|nr:polyprotein [Frankliniella fusca]
MYHAFDLAHGYHNLEIHPDDQPKTAIILPEGLGLAHRQFEFTRLSFGLAAAPGAFQYITDRVITPAKEKTPENDLGSEETRVSRDCRKQQQNQVTLVPVQLITQSKNPMDTMEFHDLFSMDRVFSLSFCGLKHFGITPWSQCSIPWRRSAAKEPGAKPPWS